MTLTTIILYIALAAILLTLVSRFIAPRMPNLGMSLVQNFCGAWFLFSGYVKVADPLGTAYKMEQYFDEFAATATGAGLGFAGPLFEFGSSVSPYVAMFMVVLEVVLGVMLVTGTRPRFTAWTFLVVMAFFTVLTGFTFLTGYVPREANFFAFAEWGAYADTNMRVTDCGCFGDFLKLEPYTSFLKDIALMGPAIAFVVAPRQLHQWWTAGTRRAVSWASVAAASLFGMSNFVWGLPVHDFRPFAEGNDLRERRRLEDEAAANVELSYELTNKATGEVIVLPMDDFLKRYEDFPAEEYEFEQLRGEPAVPHTKVSEFELEAEDGTAMGEAIFNDPGYTAMFVAYQLKDRGESRRTVTRQDSMFVADSTGAARVFAAMRDVEEVAVVTDFKPGYVADWTQRVVPFADAAEAAGWRVFAATAYADPARIDDFRHAVQFAHPIYEGDDILLKTIIRSNPGLVILKDGVVVRKFHVDDIPEFGELDLPEGRGGLSMRLD